jgi:small-conductance mechanosensitive channel
MQESNTVRVMSEVALEIMRLLAEAGIEIPLPQRDLRLRSVDAEAAAALSGDDIEREENNKELRLRVKSVP